MNRPDHATLWRRYFDERDHLRAEVKRSGLMLHAVRCPRRGHLEGVVLRTPYGPWVSWRPAGYDRTTWAQEWLDRLPGYVDVTCHHCGGRWRVDLNHIGTML